MPPLIGGRVDRTGGIACIPNHYTGFDSAGVELLNLAVKVRRSVVISGHPSGLSREKEESLSCLTPFLERVAEFSHGEAKAVVVGSSTQNNVMLHKTAEFMAYLKGLRPKNKIAATFGAYGWAGGAVKEVQVTIDGPRAIHDARRPHGSGRATFERIVRGVEALVAAGVPVNLRVVADRENLPALPALARLAEEKGWLDLPERRFKTQIGRNYELFGCASRQARGALFDRVELWTEWARLAEAHPVLRRFHRPRLHGARHLARLAAALPAEAEGRDPEAGSSQRAQDRGTDLWGPTHDPRGAQGADRKRIFKQAMSAIRAYEFRLSNTLLQTLEAIPGLHLFGPSNPDHLDARVPTFSFILEGHPAEDVAKALDAHNINTWDGNFYALSVTERLGLEQGPAGLALESADERPPPR